MKRIIVALAVAAGLNAYMGAASADPGGYCPPGGGSGNLPTFGQIAGPNTLLGAGDLPPGKMPDRYGLHPCLKKFFHVPTAMGAGSGYPGGPGCNPLANPANWPAAGYGQGGPAYNPNGFPPGAYGPGYGGGFAGGGPGCPPGFPGYGPSNPMMQGTLAFPMNGFTRSPRDYFMMDLNR